jgi:ABC-type uncharacterized transport system permease subunit
MENNTSVDHNIIGIIQGLIILFVTVQFALPHVMRWWRRRVVVSESR